MLLDMELRDGRMGMGELCRSGVQRGEDAGGREVYAVWEHLPDVVRAVPCGCGRVSVFRAERARSSGATRSIGRRGCALRLRLRLRLCVSYGRGRGCWAIGGREEWKAGEGRMGWAVGSVEGVLRGEGRWWTGRKEGKEGGRGANAGRAGAGGQEGGREGEGGGMPIKGRQMDEMRIRTHARLCSAAGHPGSTPVPSFRPPQQGPPPTANASVLNHLSARLSTRSPPCLALPRNNLSPEAGSPHADAHMSHTYSSPAPCVTEPKTTGMSSYTALMVHQSAHCACARAGHPPALRSLIQ
ncbi:hypothetical protein CALCODRAFT_158933 [Calocera cornea HHB12733]|uniref:Uncharacterized protein n=1 Tax=Calocera cornea HHB12733 TaxID=1353952 RepID=A0A165I1L4_9BASI|nr:hypothetical protein CALCODRAFT_158933 [Calocera cornea HHB12733]